MASIPKKRPPRASGAKRSERQRDLIKRFWPNLEEDDIWKAEAGYAQVPRTLTIISSIADNISGGQAVSKTYIELWCRSFEEGFVNTTNQQEFAFFSGFSGQRAQRTWLERMKKLQEMGFIKTQSGPSGEFSYCIILNPYKVIKKHLDNNEPGLTQAHYAALVTRAQEIGATPY